MVTGLEQKHLAKATVECRNDMPQLRFAEKLVANELLQSPLKGQSVVTIEAHVQHIVAEQLPCTSERIVPDRREDVRASVQIEVANVRRCFPGA